jgi:hypothetical protein
MNPPPMDQAQARGWGNAQAFAPPMRTAFSEPVHCNDAMDIDEPVQAPRGRQPRGQPPPTNPESSRQPARNAEGSLTPSTRRKGKAKALLEDRLEQEGEHLNELLRWLDHIDVDPTLADFMEDDRIAQIVVRQLLDTIDGLQADLDKEKRAQCDAEMRLIQATHKRPVSPPTSDNGREGSRQGKRMRNERGSQERAPAVPNAPPPSAPSDEPPTTATGEAPETASDRPRWKPRRSEGEAPIPTEYRVPGPVPTTPEPPCDLAPEDTTMLPQNGSNGSEDDSDDEGLWTPIEGESKQQVEQRKAHNARVLKARKKQVGQAEEAKAKKQAYEDSRPGRVPDGVGVITVNQVPERDNAFPSLLSRHYYHSRLMNIVYAGRTTVDAARVESTTGRPYTMPDHHQLYAVARRGFPMNPIKVRRLAQLVMNRHTNSADCADGYRLITELRRISIQMIPE